MRTQKLKTQYPGVRYYEHKSRKLRNGQPDRYYSIRYSLKGKVIEEGLGWASAGWSAETGNGILARLKVAARTGDGPCTLADMRGQITTSRDAQKTAKMTLGEFFDKYYLPWAKAHKRTWKNDEACIRLRVKPYLGQYQLASITSEIVRKFLDTLGTTTAMAADTIRQHLKVIQKAFTLASQIEENGLPLFTGTNPMSRFKWPRPVNNRIRFLTGEEAERLIAEAKKDRCEELSDFIIVSLNSGLRLGEICRLTWPDVNFDAKVMAVREDVTRKPGGRVPINDAVMEVLARRKALATGSVYVFPCKAGKTQEKEATRITHAFIQLVKRLGFNDGLSGKDAARRIVFHSLRHTFASWLACQGVDIYRIMHLMRHKNIAMTMRYAHLIPDASFEAVKQLKAPSSQGGPTC